MRKAFLTSLVILFFLSSLVCPAFAYDPRYRFTDQERDSESGLYNFDAREYNPNIGRFIQPDPVLNELNRLNNQKDLQNQDKQLPRLLMNPQRLNYYSYTVNNPIKYVDPQGESPAIFVPIALFVLSGVFLSDINTAYSPTYNSTPPTIESRDFGDLVPGWIQIPKLGRWGLGLMFGGLENKISNSIVSRLATKLDSELASSVAKRAEGGFINLYRAVDSGEFEKVMEKGLQSVKFITADITEAMSYMANKGFDPKLVTIRMPIEKFTRLIEKEFLKKGSFGEEFTILSDTAKKEINQYIVK